MYIHFSSPPDQPRRQKKRRIRVASLPNQENRQLKMAIDMLPQHAVKENKRLKLCVEVLLHHDGSEIDS